MDTQFVWRDEFNIGIESIDKEHQSYSRSLIKFLNSKGKEKTANGRARKESSFLKVMR